MKNPYEILIDLGLDADYVCQEDVVKAMEEYRNQPSEDKEKLRERERFFNECTAPIPPDDFLAFTKKPEKVFDWFWNNRPWVDGSIGEDVTPPCCERVLENGSCCGNPIPKVDGDEVRKYLQAFQPLIDRLYIEDMDPRDDDPDPELMKQHREVWDAIKAIRHLSSLPGKKDEWVSVEERHPNAGDRILCHGKGNRMFVAMRIGDDFVDCDGDTCDYVTHWMELPKPPKN